MKWFLITAVCLVLLVTALTVIRIVGGQMAAEVQRTCLEAQRAYLTKRFELAYTQEPPVVAIWEGTNLIAYLERDTTPAHLLPEEDRASRVFLNARLCVLFKELNDESSAQAFARRTFEWYRLVSTNEDVTVDTVLKQTLVRDRLKRGVK